MNEGEPRNGQPDEAERSNTPPTQTAAEAAAESSPALNVTEQEAPDREASTVQAPGSAAPQGSDGGIPGYDEEYKKEYEAQYAAEVREYRKLRAERLLEESPPPPIGPLPGEVSLSQADLRGLADLGGRALWGSAEAAYPPPSSTPEERARARIDAEQEQAENLKRFEYEVSAKILKAYDAGRSISSYKQAIRAYRWRGFVLLLVVLAVVVMPIVAIWTGLKPTDFGTYIAPVTGIAGTVVGYWFGQANREQEQPRQPSSGS